MGLTQDAMILNAKPPPPPPRGSVLTFEHPPPERGGHPWSSPGPVTQPRGAPVGQRDPWRPAGHSKSRSWTPQARLAALPAGHLSTRSSASGPLDFTGLQGPARRPTAPTTPACPTPCVDVSAAASDLSGSDGSATPFPESFIRRRCNPGRGFKQVCCSDL